MVQFNPNLNVGKTAKLNSSAQVGKAGAAEDKQPPKAETKAVWYANPGSYYINDNNWKFYYTADVLNNDVLILGDGTMLRCTINSDGTREFQRIWVLQPGDDDHRRGGNLFC